MFHCHNSVHEDNAMMGAFGTSFTSLHNFPSHSSPCKSSMHASIPPSHLCILPHFCDITHLLRIGNIRFESGVARLPITTTSAAGDGQFATAPGVKSPPPNEWVAQPYRMQDNANPVPPKFEGMVSRPLPISCLTVHCLDRRMPLSASLEHSA
jgi:hypothetical protein